MAAQNPDKRIIQNAYMQLLIFIKNTNPSIEHWKLQKIMTMQGRIYRPSNLRGLVPNISLFPER